jgi:hypothetical protein
MGLPDPLFGSLNLLEKATLGRFHAQRSRDRVEKLMLETHCRVHTKLISGWATRWLAGATDKTPRRQA